MRRVRLHIERLTVEGVGALDRRALGAAVERELGRLLTARPIAEPSSRAEPRLDAAPIALAPKPTPAGVGAQIGGALHGALTRSK